ncbi:hypothetical protein C8F04DRAFT_1275020 [Mycena alexandri]|uniref:Uncharacterized protein n=1 Tax=Mycena alexandri TaxID=1745969 RepID=A0AAD6WR07_9AGAR|nr:hypothetical protein C8F04DRAFT_1275020 [Mycena alexandri]
MPPTRSARISQHRQPRLCTDAALVAAAAAAASCPAAYCGRIVRVDADDHQDDAASSDDLATCRRSIRIAAAIAAVPAVSAAFGPAALRRSPRIANLSRPTRAYSLEVDPARRLPPMARSAARRYILGQPFVDQVVLQLANSGLYARDPSEGAVYCFLEVKKDEYDGVKDGTVSLTELLPSLRVKFGSTMDVSRRRQGYAKCDAGGHRRLWLFSFRTRQRYRIERLCHLAFLCEAERNIVARSLSNLKQIITEFLTAIGEQPVITELDDHRYAYQ